MIPELGVFALILALLLAVILGTLPLAGAQRNVAAWMAVARQDGIKILDDAIKAKQGNATPVAAAPPTAAPAAAPGSAPAAAAPAPAAK